MIFLFICLAASCLRLVSGLSGLDCSSVCGDRTCRLHSRAPLFPPDLSLGQQVSCDPLQEPGEGGDSVEDGLEIVPLEGGQVAVVDTVRTSADCDVSSLLSGLTYWCQGKPGGCRLEAASLSSLTSCADLGQVRVDWHSEPDYGSTEIPCPAYNRGSGPLAKKFIPLENTCYLKTRLVGSWSEARRECWRWGGELAFPLLSNKSTPRSWLQDSEEVWLAGRQEFHARPVLPPDSPAFSPGSYMACFSDLWRCTDSGGPFTDPPASARARRGLCALPPRREERLSPPCPALDIWPQAPPRTPASLACPGGQEGEARWDCGDWGLRTTHTPDYSDCAALADVNNLINNLREDQARPLEVLEEINEDIRKSEEKLGGGDIISVVELLDTAVSLQQERAGQEEDRPEDRLEDSTSFLAASLETVNSLVSQPAAWLHLGQAATQENVNNIQNIVDNAAQVLVESVVESQEGEMKIKINQTSHVELQLSLVTDTQSLQSSLADQAANISLQLSEEEHSESVVILKSYKTLGCIINGQKSCAAPRLSSKQVNSLVVGADVYQQSQEERRERKEKVEKISVEITFSHVFPGSQYSLSEVECVFWDSRDWNSSGCSLVRTDQERTTCQCQHLTNFAVLMDINNIFSPSSSSYSWLSVLSVVCSSVSVVFLVLSVWVFTWVPSVRSDRTTIHTNLCCCLLLAHLLLLTGLDSTGIPQLCSAIAVSLHFLFLASFCWMLVEGCHIYRLLTEVWQTGRCGLVPYYLLGYLLPALIVALSLLCNELMELDSYGSSQYCWLTNTHGLIWAFMGPVAVIIAVNIVIFLLAMSVARMAISRNNNLERSQEVMTQLKGCFSLISILGLSWLSGFLYLNQALSWLGVVFTITNSLQGLAIFIFHVLLNDKVRVKLVSYLRRKIAVLQEETLSRADTTKRTVKRKYLGRNDTEMSFMETETTSGFSRSEPSAETSGGSVKREGSVEKTVKDSNDGNNNKEERDDSASGPPPPPPEPEPDY